MDVYWSVERCGWVPCTGPADPLATPWSVDAVPDPAPDLPHQRMAAEPPVPAEG